MLKTQVVLPKYDLFATEMDLTHFADNPVGQHCPIELSVKMERF